jgi:hypothetical protein
MEQVNPGFQLNDNKQSHLPSAPATLKRFKNRLVFKRPIQQYLHDEFINKESDGITFVSE